MASETNQYEADRICADRRCLAGDVLNRLAAERSGTLGAGAADCGSFSDQHARPRRSPARVLREIDDPATGRSLAAAA